MKRDFRFKGTCQISYSEAAPPGYIGLPGPAMYSLIVTLENGYSIQMPMSVVEQILEPLDEESAIFFDGLKERLAPPKPFESPQPMGMKMTHEDDGSMIMRPIELPSRKKP